MSATDKGLMATIQRMLADINALKGKGITDIIQGDNITIDKKNPRKPKISSTASVGITLGGEVTGDVSSTILDKSAITSKITETIASSDYVLFGDTSDGDNLKKGLVSDIVALSGGGSLSSLTAATASNTINNVSNAQEWQWNSLTSGIGLKLSSSSTAATSNSQTLFSVNQSGTNVNSNQTTYGAIISNTKTGVGVSTLAIGLNVIATGDNPIGLKVDATSECIRNTGTYPYISFYKSGVLRSQIGHFQKSGGDNIFRINTTTTDAIYLGTNNVDQIVIQNSSLGINANPSYPLHVTGTANGTRIARFDNGAVENIFAIDYPFFHSRAGNFGSFGVNSSGNLIIGVSPTATVFQLAISSTNNNVGIGTVTPVASAILDLTSTTKGFKLPVMTSTQASAISPPAKSLMLYVTDTNGTFTSAGWWGYNGTIWKLILAE